jgi:hypothetical protein
MAVHDVHVEHPAACCFERLHLLTQAREISRQDGGKNLNHALNL